MNDSFNPDVMYNTILEAGLDWADKKAAYEATDDFTKSVLADLKTGLPGMSNAQAESEALACSKYKDHLIAKAEIRKAWLVAEVRYKALVSLAEWRRSQESTRRAEAKIL